MLAKVGRQSGYFMVSSDLLQRALVDRNQVLRLEYGS